MRCMTCHNIATVRDRWKCIPSVVGAVPRLEVGISKTLRKRFARNFLSYGLVKFMKLVALRVFVYHYFLLTENLLQKNFFQDFDNHGGGGFLVLLQLFSAAYSPLQYNLEAYSPLILRIRKLPRMARC